MGIRIRQACRGLVTSVWWVLASCSAPNAVNGDRARSLDDGVYLVVHRDDARVGGNALNEKARVVELESLPMKGEAPETILVLDEPIVRFRQMSLREFRFDDKNECSRVIFKNTDELKAFSRSHVGSRLAMVIGGKVITCHKIRVPLETDQIEISFCTEGSGDHLRKHLQGVQFAESH